MPQKMPNDIIVCIPAYKENEITKTLHSLSACDVQDLAIRVLVLINGSEKDSGLIKESNLKSFEEVSEWIEAYKGNIDFELLLELDLPVKHAGVGLARKILGNKAAEDNKIEGINGVLVYLDADCTVKKNYLQAIASFFSKYNFEAAAIHFEHGIGTNNAILEYELHLRYYILMQRFIGLPYGIHTVGSSMACLSDSYLKKGGMNRRKAGEDFYFLQKFIKDGVCGNLTETTVYPSSRKSERVPFGTGRAMLKYEEEAFEWPTYSPEAFLLIRDFIDKRTSFYEGIVGFENLNTGLIAFLESINAKESIELIKKNVASWAAFEKRFFQFFDAFHLMKCLHFLRDEYSINDVPISEAVRWYFDEVLKEDLPEGLVKKLHKIREVDCGY